MVSDRQLTSIPYVFMFILNQLSDPFISVLIFKYLNLLGMFVQESELRIILRRTTRLSYARRDIQRAVGILIGGGVQNIGKHHIFKSVLM